jgi:hypothetical protein
MIQRRGSYVLLLVLWGFASLASAQIRSGTITGTVTDTTGAVVPGANVIVTNQETNVASTATTTDGGEFNVPYLTAGTYTVTVSLTGFASFKQTGLVLTTAQTVRVTAELRMTQFDETVEVAAVGCSKPAPWLASARRTRPRSTRSASASTDGANGRRSASTAAGRSPTTSNWMDCP